MNSTLEDKTLKMRIRSLHSTFSEKENAIAQFMVANPEKVIHGTISQIASELDLADSTIFRFCKHLGYKGFQDIKIALATESRNEMKDIHERVSKNDDEKTVLEKIFHANIKTLEDTLSIIDEKVLIKAVDIILKADKIQFFGFGGSNIIAMDGFHKFIRTGLSISTQIDSHLQIMSAAQLKKSDLAILISHTGQSKDILELLETLKENNVTTIGITGFTQSPLSQGVDVTLNTLSEETDYRSEALASRIAQLSILDALYVNLMIALEQNGKDSLDSVRQAIQKKRV